jgi:hypothetical protein
MHSLVTDGILAVCVFLGLKKKPNMDLFLLAKVRNVKKISKI